MRVANSYYAKLASFDTRPLDSSSALDFARDSTFQSGEMRTLGAIERARNVDLRCADNGTNDARNSAERPRFASEKPAGSIDLKKFCLLKKARQPRGTPRKQAQTEMPNTPRPKRQTLQPKPKAQRLGRGGRGGGAGGAREPSSAWRELAQASECQAAVRGARAPPPAPPPRPRARAAAA